MNRRGFLRTLGIGAGAVVAAPLLPLVPTLPALPAPLPAQLVCKKLMARIRITEEAMADISGGAFAAAMRAEKERLVDTLIAGDEWAMMPKGQRPPKDQWLPFPLEEDEDGSDDYYDYDD